MGFLDIIKSVGKGVVSLGKHAGDTVTQANDLVQEWACKDKDFIMDKYRNGNVAEKLAANKVAIENGWKKRPVR